MFELDKKMKRITESILAPMVGEEAVVNERLASITNAGEGENKIAYPSKSSLIKGRLMLQKVAHDNSFNLTETDYSPLTAHHSLKKSAFTLAEVLITLGIIGVVAAITLPSLIQKYQKKTYIEGLKVGISIFEQGFKAAMADDGVDNLPDTQLYKACDATPYDSYEDWTTACKPLMNKYFKGIKFESVPDMKALGDTSNIMTNTDTCRKLVGKTNKWYYLNDKSKCRGWKNIAITLANGMRADFGFDSTNGTYYAGAITALDVNGGKAPNTWGRDTFYLTILKDGRVVGFCSKAEAEAYAKYNNKDIASVIEDFKTKREAKCNNTTTEEGMNCSGRVIDEGWVMNY